MNMVSYPKLLVFEKAVTRMMNDGYTVDVIYLDFAGAFLFRQSQISFGEDEVLRSC